MHSLDDGKNDFIRKLIANAEKEKELIDSGSTLLQKSS